jgi:hypothetical protein
MSNAPSNGDGERSRRTYWNAGTARGDRKQLPKGMLPEDCPVEPLGLIDGMIVLLDSLGVLRRLAPRDLTHNMAVNLCAAFPKWLPKWFPRRRRIGKGKDEDIPGTIEPKRFFDRLQAACAWRGIIDLDRQVRGRGAWRGAGGDLILHCGDYLWISGGTHPVGCHGDYIYPKLPPLPLPWDKPVPGPHGPAGRVLSLFKTWNWQRPMVDPVMLLGVICVSQLGAALKTRPNAFVRGEPETGKSLLLEMIGLMQEGWLLQTADATAAGIMQTQGIDALGVAIDQKLDAGTSAMGNEGYRQVAAILELFRAAYSGGEVLRGGMDHRGMRFRLNYQMIASCVTLPAFDVADHGRIIVLELIGRPSGPEPNLTPELKHFGQQQRRRLADHWKRLQTEVLPAFRSWLMSLEFTARGADTYGTVMACAWIALYDHLPGEADFADYEGDFRAILETALVERVPSWQAALTLLLSLPVDQVIDGVRPIVVELLRDYAGYGPAERADRNPRQADFLAGAARSEPEAIEHAHESFRAREAGQLLKRLGIRLIFIEPDPERGRPGGRMLAIAAGSEGLEKMLRDTPFGGRGLRSSVLHNVLKRAPAAFVSEHPVRFPFGKVRAVILPLTLALDGVVLDSVVASSPDAVEASRSLRRKRQAAEF